MRESKKTILEFDEGSVESFKQLQKALKPSSGPEPSNRDLFLLAMSYGFKHGALGGEIKRSGTGPRVQYFKAEDQALMAAIQIGHDNSTENIADMERRYELAELYAQGGILLLRTAISDAVKYGNELAAEIIELLPIVNSDDTE
jgi:hypothetical protein